MLADAESTRPIDSATSAGVANSLAPADQPISDYTADSQSPDMTEQRLAKYAASPAAPTEDSKGKGPATAAAAKKSPPPPTGRSVSLTIDQSPLQAATAKPNPPLATGAAKKKSSNSGGANPKKTPLGFDCFTTDSVSRWPLNILKRADSVLPPKDIGAVESQSDEKLLESAAVYTYRVITSDRSLFLDSNLHTRH